ncbi:uncharacterized protein LOC116767128 [Danaus plexippus]|uniref:uncharacterized protein LOC116767128 n=1 Tax=Danaus plexippus TaxID=13037 RepID=UPI002AB19522|nr:uncharacterized protein LOC116767128 [Danaus plexippus]
MSRLGCFVFVYSVILLILFGVFCYLMSTVNPPAQIQDPGSRKYGTDHFVYSDEVFGDDVAAYGLEKAIDYYNSFDIFPRSSVKNPLYRGISTPKIYMDQTSKSNHTKKIFQLVTKSIKHSKGLRRSIYEENLQDDALLKLIHLKIKNVNGHPAIEIKVVPETGKNKESRKTRRTNNNRNEETDYEGVDRDEAGYVNNYSDEVFIELVQNDTIVLNFDDNKINVSNTNNIKDEDLLLKSITNAEVSDKGTEINTKLYTLNLLSTGQLDEHRVTNRTDHTKKVERTTASYRSTRSGSNGTRLMTFLFNSIYKKNNKTEPPCNTSNMTTIEDSSEDEDTITHNPVDTLAGLLIQEATATNSYNII